MRDMVRALITGISGIFFGGAMQLSPLNLFGIRDRVFSIGTEDLSHSTNPKVQEVVMYQCNVCGDLHRWEDDAEECCPSKETLEEPHKAFCPVCGEEFHHLDGFRSAADCCLWKDLDAITRWRIADAVEAGSDWVTELGLTHLQVL